MTIWDPMDHSVDVRVDISAIVCTWNRRQVLAAALGSIASQASPDFNYEIIVVDNNSTDDTASAVEPFVASNSSRIRYIFEPRQGISHARNAGIAVATAPLLAFFDDDVSVGSDWLQTIKNAFERHQDVDYIGGKVLPRWRIEPPEWLGRENWAPIAVQDHGDTAFYLDAGDGPGLISANLAIRRRTLDQVGCFRPELQRVKDGIGSMEDQELLERMQRAGNRGLYLPELVVWADVPEQRMTKTYHRRWHRGHGEFYAISRSASFERTTTGRLFDVPAHLYRQAVIDAARWVWRQMRGHDAAAFAAESRLWFFLGFLRRRFVQSAWGPKVGREIIAFISSHASRLVERRRTRNAGRS